jgi:hypothetical protein
MVLTHFGPVGDLERLSGDLHTGIDEFVAVARRHAGVPERADRIAEDVFAYLSARLDSHGFAGDEELRHQLLDPDVRLNTQGLEVWLARA